jgi:hypothetical protein
VVVVAVISVGKVLGMGQGIGMRAHGSTPIR